MDGKKRFFSLKTKIMTATLIPVIVSFILICSVIFLSLFNSLQETAKAGFLQVSQKYASSFEGKINTAMNYLSILSCELEMQIETGSTDRKTLQKTILSIFNEYKLIDGSSVYFEPDMYDGHDADYLGSAYGTAKSGRICWYYYTDNGETAYLPEGMGNEIEFELPHYTKAKEANMPIYTDPVSYEIDGKNIPMFTLTYPIQDSSGNFIGAVTVDLFLNDIYTQLQNEKIYETGYVFIANDNGQIIYSPHYEDIGSTREEAGLDYPLPSGDESSVFFNAKSVENGKDTLVTIDSVYIPQLDSHFYVSVTAPLDEINAGGARLMILLVTFGAFVVVAIALLLYYLIGKISAPLYEITQSVNKIAGGDYHARIKGEYRSEFAVVKDSVNMMADSIEAYMHESEDSLHVMKNILNGLDAVIYVTVPETGEILFINEHMKEHYNIKGEAVGQICYKILQQGMEQRCDFCPCYQLDKEPDAVVVWEEHSTLTKRDYRNTDLYIDWIGGQKAHLQHSVDITDIKEVQLALDRRLGQQALMTSISQSFLSDADTDVLITDALRMIGEFIGVAQILFYKLEEDRATLTCQNEWINPELGLQTRIGDRLVLNDAMLSVISGLSEEKHFCLTSNDPLLKAAMAPYRVNFQDYIAAPIFVKGNIYGVLDFSKADNGQKWSQSDISLATLVSSLLSGAFERRFMEGQLRRLSSIVESSSQFIMDITAEGKVDYVNPATKTITGYSEEELIEGGLGIIFDEQTVRNIKEKHIPNTLRNGSDHFEIELLCKAGRKRIMAFSSFTTGSDSANVSGIASDVTEIRKLEAELIAAKELAEQGSRSKSEFLSRMSHEIRTPMNAIIGMTKIADSSQDIEKIRYCLSTIGTSSEHLLGLINDILDMSKIEAGKFELDKAYFNIEKMLMKICNLILDKTEQKNQTLHINLGKNLHLNYLGDELRLSQVITNLLANAVKFTPEEGKITLTVDEIKTENDCSTLRFSIFDTGIGMTPEQIKRLFTSFEQADGSISRRYGGTGLGLAISKSIVEKMSGKIWVDSEIGNGSTFTFDIVVERPESSKSRIIFDGITASDLKILVADHSGDIREQFLRIMNNFEIYCDAADSGESAMSYIKKAHANKRPYDVVFLEYDMPDISGIEIMKRLHGKIDKNTVIVMMSFSQRSELEQDAKQAGICRFLTKPLFPSAILDAINDIIGGTVKSLDMKTVPVKNTADFSNVSLLLVEDIEINREIFIALMEETNIKIDVAENGLQAVQKFKDNAAQYDIIIMDVQMPEMDGYEATSTIRALDMPCAKTIPIIAMTANAFKEDIDRCMASGMNDHVSKPIDVEKVMETIARYAKK